MTVPYTFATATSAIPLSQLDSNFATAITLGSTALYLGNTTTTIAGLTLTSPTLTTPALGTPASGVLTNCTGLPAGSITGTLGVANGGTGVTTSTGTGNVVLSTSPTLVTPVLGTPTSVTLTNATGLPLSTGVTGTLATTNGGTGLTSFTSGGVVYASSASALATGSALTFDGTGFQLSTSTGGNFYLNSTTTGTSNQIVSLLNNGNGYGNLNYKAFDHIWSYGASEQMRLTSSSLYTASGINVLLGNSTDPLGGNRLLVQSAATGNNNRTMSVYNTTATSTTAFANRILQLSSNGSSADVSILFSDQVANNAFIGMVGASLNFAASNVTTPQMTLTSGNLGLGVTPSTNWTSAGSQKAMQVGNYGALSSSGTGAGGYYQTVLGMNCVDHTTSTKYLNTGVATAYVQATGQHQWLTAASGTAGDPITFTQAMTLDASGALLVGQTSPSQSVLGFSVSGAGGTYPAGTVNTVLAGSTNAVTTWNTYSTGAGAYRFYVGMGGTIFATSIVITAISDQRLKENIRDIDTGLGAIMALKPRRFDWKDGKGQDKKNAAGFIAQEFEEVFPECVSTSKAGDDGIEYKNINHETLIPTLVKAMQEQQALIESLTTRLAALEAA